MKGKKRWSNKVATLRSLRLRPGGRETRCKHRHLFGFVPGPGYSTQYSDLQGKSFVGVVSEANVILFAREAGARASGGPTTTMIDRGSPPGASASVYITSWLVVAGVSSPSVSSSSNLGCPPNFPRCSSCWTRDRGENPTCCCTRSAAVSARHHA